MSPGIEALAAVLGCQVAAAVLAALLASAGHLRVTFSIGRPRGRKTPGERM